MSISSSLVQCLSRFQLSRCSITHRYLYSTIPDRGSDAHTELQSSLPGTAQSHLCHIFLRSPIPPAEFSEKYTTSLQRDLLLRVRKLGGIVSLAWYGSESVTQPGSAVAFSSRNGRLDIPEVSSENMDQIVQQLKDHIQLDQRKLEEDAREVDVYVCTHGARDCRCGDVGGRVADALREEAQRLNAQGDSSTRIRVGEIGHIGGHKYAANVIVHPHGEWLGLVRPEDAPKVLQAAMSARRWPLGVDDPILLKEHWRGRMGLTEEEQLGLFEGETIGTFLKT